MALDYAKIRVENERRYGTDIGRIGKMLLADRYDNRAHFIYELLQNAEDAFSRNAASNAPRSISFVLTPGALRVSHFGSPFSERDVRGICGIADSAKDLTAIGRFGIGFKSVYAFTSRPQIHSAGEHFAIESFVWPLAIESCEMRPEETVFILPLVEDDANAFSEITEGLKSLGPRALLFLKNIEEITWSVEGGPSGLYLRSKPEPMGTSGRKIVVIGQGGNAKESEETWLVFSREVRSPEGVEAGFVEVAFRLAKAGKDAALSIAPIIDSTLVVFFPTIVPTNLGLLLQGPYRTTPSRDNIPRDDAWNRHLVQETATLLIEALRSLRDLGLLSANALRSLPMDSASFGEGQMFSPLFRSVRDALSSERLLPTFGVGYSSAKIVKLARTQELRDLISPSQLGTLFGNGGETFWLSEDITQDRMPELRQYLLRELGIIEVTPELIVTKFDKAFLEQQSDEWIRLLYEFLNGQPALSRLGRLANIPLVRLADGSHVIAQKNGKLQAFLPGPTATDFPTVRANVCDSKASRAFLTTLGLTEPDPVDDVIWNVLPKYAGEHIDLTDYEADIRRIMTAFATDSKGQREKLVKALRETPFVRVVDTGDQSKWVARPEHVYLATQRLKDLFDGVPKVYLVDEAYGCLRGDAARELLEASGATRYLQPTRIKSRFNWQDLAKMRAGTGSTAADEVNDFTLRGLDQLLATLPTLSREAAVKRAGLLWEALCDLVDRRGAVVFLGTYYWFYRTQRSQVFEAAFVLRLKEASWVPNRDGVLQPSQFVVFEETGWKANPFLQSTIGFKPAIIETLAKEAGIEPGVLDLLRKLGVTSEAELKRRLGIRKDEAKGPEGNGGPAEVDDALKKVLGDAPPPTPPVPDSGPEPEGAGGSGTGARGPAEGRSGAHPPGSGAGGGEGSDGGGRGHGVSTGGGTGPSGRTSGDGSGGRGGADKGQRATGGGRPFVSYIGAHPHDSEPDPDGLDQAQRLALEEQAIKLILASEPELCRTATNNPGFDLVGVDGAGAESKWVEVKAMTGTLQDRPVGLSHTQFDCARDHGSAYWLYIVERAGVTDQARIVHIQDPARRSSTFTFDKGWVSIAETEHATPAIAHEDRDRSDTDGTGGHH